MVDALGLQVRLETLETKLASPAGLLVAAEGDLVGEKSVLIGQP